MEAVPKVDSTFNRQVYLWRIRLRIWGRNFIEFIGELRKHPVAITGGVIIILYVLAAVFADYITVYDPTQGDLRARLEPPFWYNEGTWVHPLGTDGLGRDILTRIIYGARISLSVGVLSVAISVLIGLILGSDTVLGLYYLAFKLPHYMLQLQELASTVVYPAFTKARDDTQLREASGS